MAVKHKYEASNDGVTWTEVLGFGNPETSAWKWCRQTSWEITELELVKEQLKNANNTVDELRKELAVYKTAHVQQSYQQGLGNYGASFPCRYCGKR